MRRSEAPVAHAATARVARADDEVGAAVEGGHERRQVVGRMRPVGVHLDDAPGAAREHVGEAVDVGPAEALLAGAMEDLDARVRGGQAVGQRPGAVGRGVVDDEQVRAGQRVEDGAR